MDFELLHSCFEMWITSSVITGLGGQAADGKWVCEGQTLNTGTRPHRLHLTLHFAGETVVACWRSQVSHASWAHPHGSPPHYYEQQNVKNETGTQTMKETQAGWRANSPETSETMREFVAVLRREDGLWRLSARVWLQLSSARHLAGYLNSPNLIVLCPNLSSSSVRINN